MRKMKLGKQNKPQLGHVPGWAGKGRFRNFLFCSPSENRKRCGEKGDSPKPLPALGFHMSVRCCLKPEEKEKWQ
jgi:hypothetical protein